MVRWPANALDLTCQYVAAELGYAPDAVPDFVRSQIDALLRPRATGTRQPATPTDDRRPRLSETMEGTRPRLSEMMGDSRPRLSGPRAAAAPMGDSRPRLSDASQAGPPDHPVRRDARPEQDATARPALLEPRGLWRIIPARVQRDAIECHSDAGVVALRVGPIVASQLRGSTAVAVFVVTVGSAISDAARRCWASGDALTGCLLDALGSAAAERCAELIAAEIARRCALIGWHTTHRFSPGYCTWPTDQQRVLFSLLEAGRIGVRLSDSGMMDPLKSVSGIIGTGPDVRWRPYPCDNCGIKDCTYRARPHPGEARDVSGTRS